MSVERIKYPLLIAENIENDLVFLKNALKRECAGQVWLDIKDCTTGQEARAVLRETLCPFVSLDRRMPEQIAGAQVDDLGDRLRDLAVRLNPLSHVGMLTAYPDPQSAYDAGSARSTYKIKKDMTAIDYAKVIVSEIRAFERTIAWQKAATVLPPVLAAFAKDIADDDDSDDAVLRRSACARSLWESGIHFIALMELAAVTFIKPALLRGIHVPHGRIDNESVIILIKQLTPALQAALKEAGYPAQAREVGRFIGHSTFMLALRMLQDVRNQSAHSAPVVARTLFLENASSFLTFLLGVSLWALHPLVVGLKVVPWGTSNGLKAKRLHGSWNLTSTPTWIWDARSSMQVNPNHVYQALIEPEAEDRALLIPLYPLIRFERSGEAFSLWLAHDASKGLYCNVANGIIYKFEDGALSAWWNEYHRVKAMPGQAWQVEGVEEPASIMKAPESERIETPEPERPETDVRKILAEFYISTIRANPKEQDETYQASFDGEAKAKDVLHFLEKRNDLLLSELAYVSIGGADGSEIMYILRNSPVRFGILVEFSDYGAVSARKGSDLLKRDGKELVVLQGDAMKRIRACGDILSRWREKDLFKA